MGRRTMKSYEFCYVVNIAESDRHWDLSHAHQAMNRRIVSKLRSIQEGARNQFVLSDKETSIRKMHVRPYDITCQLRFPMLTCPVNLLNKPS
ncbi:MAG: hypothetical protein L6R40_006433 [Gallowayella cf. fulva]|nr:MAG: hypothetical protein L6R40_006433 [Xanthomendoza cf. fulva]